MLLLYKNTAYKPFEKNNFVVSFLFFKINANNKILNTTAITSKNKATKNSLFGFNKVTLFGFNTSKKLPDKAKNDSVNPMANINVTVFRNLLANLKI